MKEFELTIDGQRQLLTTDHAASRHGIPVLVRGSDAIGPGDACRLRIEAGSDEALAALAAAGFEFDDCRP